MMQNIAKLLRAACAGCPVAILALACSGGGEDTASGNASGSGGQTSQGGIGGAAGGSEPLPEQGGSGGAQTQPGAGGSTAGSGGFNDAQGGAGGTSQDATAPEGDERWHCIGTMQQSACSCVLATTEPVAPYESGCPSRVSYVCCYTSDTFNPDDACSCWTESGLEQLGQTCEQLLQVVETAGGTRVDSCSND